MGLPSLEPNAAEKAPIGPFLVSLPKAHSAISAGIANNTVKIKYIMRKALPPYFPIMYGKRQTFPSPMETPIMVMIVDRFDENSWRFGNKWSPSWFVAKNT